MSSPTLTTQERQNVRQLCDMMRNFLLAIETEVDDDPAFKSYIKEKLDNLDTESSIIHGYVDK